MVKARFNELYEPPCTHVPTAKRVAERFVADPANDHRVRDIAHKVLHGGRIQNMGLSEIFYTHEGEQYLFETCRQCRQVLNNTLQQAVLVILEEWRRMLSATS